MEDLVQKMQIIVEQNELNDIRKQYLPTQRTFFRNLMAFITKAVGGGVERTEEPHGGPSLQKTEIETPDHIKNLSVQEKIRLKKYSQSIL